MNKILISTVLIAFYIAACNSPTKEQQEDAEGPELTVEERKMQDLEDEVMAIHDQVMPQLGTLMSLKEQLVAKNQSLATGNNANAADQVIVNDLLITNLDQAREEMMIWMRGYKGIDPQGDVSLNISYLEEEKRKIEVVKDQVGQALRSAQEALDQ